MLRNVIVQFLLVLVQSRLKSVDDISILDDMDTSISVASLETLYVNAMNHLRQKILTYRVGDVFKAHAASVVGGSLLGVADPEANVIETVENTDFRLTKEYNELGVIDLL